jgi:para-aminobenzoate synthetase component 1
VQTKRYSIVPDSDFIYKALKRALRESHAQYLNPNGHTYPHGAFIHVLAFGMYDQLEAAPDGNFERLKNFAEQHRRWMFGYLSYDLKDELESLSSPPPNPVGFAKLHFFVPKHLIFIEANALQIQSTEDPDLVLASILAETIEAVAPVAASIADIKARTDREGYLERVRTLQQHIAGGDIYEANFCLEYFSEAAVFDPLHAYLKLNALSPMPFSALLKHEERFVLCASPERFLKHCDSTLISQPIKGTARREADPETDKIVRENLKNNPKERSENIMIVDLVRNDLSQTAIAGSVVAEEVCGLYSYQQVHQLVSTVRASLHPSFHPVDALRQAFPMGSMTGAPKVNAMKLIDQREATARGLFSGAIGYFTPELNFDFNVVIRSMLYNRTTRYLSFWAGSAITHSAEAEKEYEECLVKTSAIRQTLNEL